MSLNADQQDYIQDLNQKQRQDLCPCGWYSERECLQHCSTGDRNNAPALVRRIQEIYKQIDKANSAKDTP